MGRPHKATTSASSSDTATGGATGSAATKHNLAMSDHTTSSTMQRLFGFEMNDFSSWSKFVHLMSRPMDPSNLALTRIIYGVLMIIRLTYIQGLSYVFSRWGDSTLCTFPVFNFLPIFELKLMFGIYACLLIATIGLTLGLFYRLSCFVHVVLYWYIFLLDTTLWNNHTYLFGLLGVLFLLTDANRCWSIDGLLTKRINNMHIPLWNYTLFRAQIFMVYFIAGTKKLETDWIHGYSMTSLGTHWVFEPFKYVLTQNQVDLCIVHWGGLLIDLFLGFLLFFNVTRPFGMLVGFSFHGMNSQIFRIGMFPYAMIGTMPLFAAADWPKQLFKSSKWAPLEPSSSCLYHKHQIKPEQAGDGDSRSKLSKDDVYNSAVAKDRPTSWHHLYTMTTVLYILIQAFLPYSHFITKTLCVQRYQQFGILHRGTTTGQMAFMATRGT